MKKLLYILFCITLISCNSKTEGIKEEEIVVFSDNGTTIYESDIYEVINTFFEDQKETNILDGIDYNGKLLTVYPNSNYIHPNDFAEFGIISKEDKYFIFQQIDSLDKYDLKQEYFIDFKLIPRIEIENMWSSWEKEYMSNLQNGTKFNWKEFFNQFETKYQKTEFYYITIPLFSKDKNTAIIVFGTQLIPTGGNGRVHIYKKEKNKWIRTDKGLAWLSS